MNDIAKGTSCVSNKYFKYQQVFTRQEIPDKKTPDLSVRRRLE